jgi:hypothetical protein
MQTFVEIIEIALTKPKFVKLAKLVDICGTFQASRADAERGYNLMNAKKILQAQPIIAPDHFDDGSL